MIFRRLFSSKGPKEFKTLGGATVVIVGRVKGDSNGESVKVKVVDAPRGAAIPTESGGTRSLIGAIIQVKRECIKGSNKAIERKLREIENK